jgi:crossover junction endodeoxyribonuclease RusA
MLYRAAVTVRVKRMKITINEIPPSNNKYLGNSHSFREYSKEKDRWHWLVKAAIKVRPKKPYAGAVVKITYFFRDKKRRDPDNYSGKFILDALVKERIIIDDNFDVISLVLNNGGVDKTNPRTVIEIEEANYDQK